MAWIPSLISEKGIYGGRKIPQGSLNHYADDAGVVDNVITRSADLAAYWFDPDPPDVYWPGSFGVSISALQNRIHLNDPEERYIKCFEIEVEKPENAQYYKQTLAFYVDLSGSTTEYQDYTVIRYVWGFSRIARIEYATPYDDNPTIDVIAGGGVSGVGQIIEGELPANNTQYENGATYIGISKMTKDNENYICIYTYIESSSVSINTQTSEAAVNNFSSFRALGISDTLMQEYFGTDELVETEDPNEEEPPEDGPGGGGGGGGNGEHQLPDEPVPIPPLPEIGAASVSWLKVYKMTVSQVSDFGNQMTPTTAWQLLQTFFQNPLEAIVAIMLVPVDAPTAGARTPHVGDFAWDKAYPIIDNEFVELDCGNISIPPYWDSAFDMSPYTKLQVFLPFVGYREIDADEVMGANINIVYHIDVCTGDCTVFIKRFAGRADMYGFMYEQVIAQYNGNCAVRVPTGRTSHDSAVSAGISLLGSAINIGGSIVGAALGDVGSISASQVANQVSGATMTSVNGMKKHIERSGNIAGAAGYMGIVRPYIIRQIPWQDLPKEYKRLEGYPANKGGTLLQFEGTGLNTVESIELNGFSGFESERVELLSKLRGGVII